MFIKCSLNEVSSRSRFTLIKLILSVCLLQLCLAVQISGPHNKTKIKKVKKNVYVNETDLIQNHPHKHLANFGKYYQYN